MRNIPSSTDRFSKTTERTRWRSVGKSSIRCFVGRRRKFFFFLWFQLLPPVSKHASPVVVAETMTSLPLRATNRRKEFQNESTSRDSRSSKQTAHRSAGLRSTVTISVDVDKKSINWQHSHKDWLGFTVGGMKWFWPIEKTRSSLRTRHLMKK